MKLVRRLAGFLGWIPLTALTGAVIVGLVIATVDLVEAPILDFFFALLEATAIVWLLVAAWWEERGDVRRMRGPGGARPGHVAHPPPKGEPPPIRSALEVAFALGLLAFGIYLVRPLGVVHGPLWLLVKYPLLWIVTTAVAVLAGVGVHRAGGRSTVAIGVPVIVAWLVALIPMAWLSPKLSALATYHHYTYVQIAKLPSGGEVRILPHEVAEQMAAIGYNRSGHGLGPGHLILDPQDDRLTWTFEQAPNGLRNVLRGHTAGIALLDAQETNRMYHQIDTEFRIAPGMQITDNTKWKIYKDSYFSVPTAPIPVVTKDGEPEIVVPTLTYRGSLVKYPAVGTIYVFHPDGRIEKLSAAEARGRPDIVDTGRIVSSGLAREIQNAYAYKHGLWNTSFSHNDQTQIVDSSDSDNQQPYLMAFSQTADGKPLPAGETERLYWVSSAEPRGHAFATKAIFLTDAITAVTYVWSVPTDTSLTGAIQAVQDAKSLAIPGIVFQASYENGVSGAGRYQVVEPRPVFVKRRLQYLLSIIPTSHNNVTKSVIVDAASNKVIAIFNHDTDAGADRKLVHYLRTGVLDQSAVVTPNEVGQPGGTSTPVSSTTPSSTPAPAGQSVAQLLASNAQLLRQVRQNQARIEQLLAQQAHPR